MKYIYLIIFCFLFIKTEIKANTLLKPFEFEISLGGTYGIDKYVGNKQIGPAFALEGRYNFCSNPIDIGMELYGGSTARNYEASNCRICLWWWKKERLKIDMGWYDLFI